MGILPKFNSLIIELGRWNALLYLVESAFRRLGGGVRLIRYYIVAQPVPSGSLLSARRSASIAIRRIGPGDPAFAGFPLTEDVLRYRFDQQAICFAAFRGDEAVGCLWLCLGPYDEDEIRCTFVPSPASRAAWDFDVYVHPDHRTGFVFARLWDAANAFMRERGIGWSVSRISAFNAGSLASHRRLGAARRASVTALRCNGWQAAFATMRPYVHISLAETSRPVYRISVAGTGRARADDSETRVA